MAPSRERWMLGALHISCSCRASVLPENPVFQAFYLRHDPGFQCLGAVQVGACPIEKSGIDPGSSRQRLIVGARHDAGFVCLAPLDFQIAHMGVEVEFEVETAHRLPPEIGVSCDAAPPTCRLADSY